MCVFVCVKNNIQGILEIVLQTLWADSSQKNKGKSPHKHTSVNYQILGLNILPT